MTNEVGDRLFVIESKTEDGEVFIRTVSLINDMRSPWLREKYEALAIDWGERHQRHHERLLGALEGIADRMPPR